MMEEHIYRVAGLPFRVLLPAGTDADRMLPSFRPFRSRGEDCGEYLFRFTADGTLPLAEQEWGFVEESSSDLGHVRLLESPAGYRVEVRSTAGGTVHVMHSDARFTEISAQWHTADPRAGQVLCSMLRIVFSQAVLQRGGISLHAAAVALDGKAYLFMGRSGTGKSTHAVLWQRRFPQAELLNDDNPTVRMEDGRAVAYGTPWSGKTPCYKDKSFPIGGIVRLAQAGVNRFTLQEGTDAFITVLPGCSVIRRDSFLHAAFCDTLAELAGAVTVGRMECLPDTEAAQVCADALRAAQGQELKH